MTQHNTITQARAQTPQVANQEQLQQPQQADSTRRCSQAVPDPSTNRALSRLTSEVRRDPVHSTRYGRQRKVGLFEIIYFCMYLFCWGGVFLYFIMS